MVIVKLLCAGVKPILPLDSSGLGQARNHVNCSPDPRCRRKDVKYIGTGVSVIDHILNPRLAVDWIEGRSSTTEILHQLDQVFVDRLAPLKRALSV